MRDHHRHHREEDEGGEIRLAEDEDFPADRVGRREHHEFARLAGIDPALERRLVLLWVLAGAHLLEALP